jgi:hypothetical protein
MSTALWASIACYRVSFTFYLIEMFSDIYHLYVASLQWQMYLAQLAEQFIFQ